MNQATAPILIVDFNQVVIAACAVKASDLKGLDVEDSKKIIKSTALLMLMNFKKRFNPHKIILAADSKNYWRKKVFKWYKGHRKQLKEDNKFLDFDLMHVTLDELKVELKENFPYTVMEVDGAEADDVIAILCKFFQENELVFTGLIEEPRPIVICSTDGDFQQLQKYRNVTQWNNVQQKFIVCKNPKQYLIEHIAMGDDGDNVPSIPNGDRWAQMRAEGTPERAKSFKKARLEAMYHRGIDACDTEEEKRNWRRNEMLVDLDLIPSFINNRVVSAYTGYVTVGKDPMKIFNYLIRSGMKLMVPNIGDF